jgi:hypothetical protein
MISGEERILWRNGKTREAGTGDLAGKQGISSQPFCSSPPPPLPSPPLHFHHLHLILMPILLQSHSHSIQQHSLRHGSWRSWSWSWTWRSCVSFTTSVSLSTFRYRGARGVRQPDSKHYGGNAHDCPFSNRSSYSGISSTPEIFQPRELVFSLLLPLPLCSSPAPTTLTAPLLLFSPLPVR